MHILSRDIDDECQKMIVDYLKKFEKGHLSDFEKMLFDKLPDSLTLKQKKNKIKNTLQGLKKAGSLRLDKSRFWVLSETKKFGYEK